MEAPLTTIMPEMQSMPPSGSSFRSEFRHRLPSYRTPSPPRHAFEPLSPVRAASALQITDSSGLASRKRSFDDIETQNNHTQGQWPTQDPRSSRWSGHRVSQAGPAPIDTHKASRTDSTALQFLAALATSPSLAARDRLALGGFPPSCAISAADHQFPKPQPFERASKRSRSEVIHPRPVFNYESRPSTSYALPPTFSPSSPNVAPTNHTRTSSGTHYHSIPSSIQQHTEDDVREDAELLLSISRGVSESANQRRMPSMSSWRVNGATEGTHRYQSIRHDLNSAPQPLYHSPRRLDENSMPEVKQSTSSQFQHRLNAAPYQYPMPLASSRSSNRDRDMPLKPRDHRGWPKGKLRGPRSIGTDGKRRSKPAKKSDVMPLDGPSNNPKKKTSVQANTQHIPDNGSTAWDMRFDVPSEVRRPRRGSDSRLKRRTSEFSPSKLLVQPRHSSAPPAITSIRRSFEKPGQKKAKVKREYLVDICKACNQNRDSQAGSSDIWINCKACKAWLHEQCAGLGEKRKVNDVDKYYCGECQLQYGPITYVRKSSRAHVSVDYAGLNEGRVRTAVDIPDHHYIEPIKNGTLEFQPETFPRLPPELVTREYLERCGSWREPILIPAALNPRPIQHEQSQVHASPEPVDDGGVQKSTYDFAEQYEYDCVPDDGQDKLDMVIPNGLTVRRVAELYGPEEKVDVIDVKLQEGEDRRWTMGQWADYYEAEGAKPVRNVISLEVSHSLLGKLIRRPKVVRDLDLQDSVWPEEDAAKGIWPRVQFYCLMSVADCYTDFHIDFGGSSVYYHILKGQKTFFFIPPKSKNLKKYEEWCNSPDQHSVFLGNETKECYRVDLYPGDTMLIPSGWIHAVWTPENSLVIGGNFLTRMHFGMQITINEIEKATNVTRKFRYPYFQKILWLTVIRYLEQDPIPSTVVHRLTEGRQFERSTPIFLQSSEEEELAQSDDAELELRNARYYSESELNGLPDLIRYVYRTVLISLGKLPGISKSTQDAVIKSMPKDCGDHLELLRTFAMWTAWKRGNENIPSWAYPDAALVELDANASEGKLGTAVQKRLERQAMRDALNATGSRRTSLRAPKASEGVDAMVDSPIGNENFKTARTVDSRRMACDACRKSKRRCIHNGAAEEKAALPLTTFPTQRFGVKAVTQPNEPEVDLATTIQQEPSTDIASCSATSMVPQAIYGPTTLPMQVKPPALAQTHLTTAPPAQNSAPVSSTAQQKPKNRACEACRKSKHRCTHNLAPLPNKDSNGPLSVPKRPASDQLPSHNVVAKKLKRDPVTSTKMAGVVPSVYMSTDIEARYSLSSAPPHATVATTTSTNGIIAPSTGTPSELQPSMPNRTHSSSAPRVPLNGITTGSPYDFTHAHSHEPSVTQLGPETQSAAPFTQQSASDASNSTTRTSSNSNSDIRSRASSLHIRTAASSPEEPHGSRSPPTSPLTEPEPSSPTQVPEAASVPRQTAEPVSPVSQRTPRQRKQVERYNDVAFAANAAASPPPSERKTPVDRRRQSTASSSGKANGIRSTPAPSRKPSTGTRTSAHGSPVNEAAAGLEREKTKQEMQEEESLRLAKELAAQDAGLRRRGEVRYGR